jgi:hypothetical protein
LLDDEPTLNRYLCLAVDIQGYSAQPMHGQHDFQEALHHAIRGAASDARLDRPSWQRQDQGDGELALVPAGPDEPRVMDAFVTFLRARVERYNAPRVREHRMRVRVAFHAGWARRSALGYAGEDVVAVGRLVSAPVLKEALAALPEAQFGVIVSDAAFSVIRQGLTTLPGAEFVPADVVVKEFTGRAWVWVPAPADRGTVFPAAAAAASGRDAQSPTQPPVPLTRASGNSVIITGGSVSGSVAAGPGARASQSFGYDRPPHDTDVDRR